MFAKRASSSLVAVLALGAALALSVAIGGSPATAAARSARHCGRLHGSGFPSVRAIRAKRIGCGVARGVGRSIARTMRKEADLGEHAMPPARVGPVDGRHFQCRSHEVSNRTRVLYDAVRCRSGRATVRLRVY